VIKPPTPPSVQPPPPVKTLLTRTPNPSENVILISQPIYDGQKRFVGAICLQFDAHSMVKSIVDANVKKLDFIYQ
jgi:hypothetical protein